MKFNPNVNMFNDMRSLGEVDQYQVLHRTEAATK